MHIQTIPLKADRRHKDRYLITIDLRRVSEALDAPLTVVYTNVMDPGAIAGNHFHKRKREVFRSAFGRFEVTFFDLKTKERKTVFLDSDPESPDFIWLVVPDGVPHAVKNISDSVSRLDVFSTEEPRISDDDFSFQVIPKLG